MILIVHQSIEIHTIRIDGISNASVLQIGTSGIIKPLNQMLNTGGFTAPAPEAKSAPSAPYVPLVSPSS